MKKRGFFIPIIICFSILVLIYLFELLISYGMLEITFTEHEGNSSLGAAFGTIFGIVGLVYASIYSVVLALPVWILSGIYSRKAKQHNLIRWPTFSMSMVSIVIVTHPWFFLFLISFFSNLK